MDNFAITAADAVSRRYKSNDPEAIIAQRAIKIKDIRFCEELLGFYTVLLNCEYIGINPNCSKQQRRSALAHELGHAIFDRKHAASGQAFQDTYFIVSAMQKQSAGRIRLLLNCCCQMMMY